MNKKTIKKTTGGKKIAISEVEILKKITQTIASSLDLEEVLKRILDMVAQITQAEGCHIYLYDETAGELVLMESQSSKRDFVGQVKLSMGEGVTGWVAAQRQQVVLEKEARKDSRFKFVRDIPEDKYQAFLSTPIINQDRLIGVINVRHNRPHKYPKGMADLIMTIASQVGVAITNASLYEEATTKKRQVNALSEVSAAAASNRYIEEILQLIVTVTAEMMGSKICSIMLLDEKKGEMFIAATQSLSEEYKSKPNLKVVESISGRSLRIKKPVVVRDVRKDKEYMFRDIAKREGLVSMLAVPMMIRDRAVGVIGTYTSVPHSFSGEEIKIMQGVANQAAVAIENTKLLNRIGEMEENIETRKLVEKAKGILMKESGLSEQDAYRAINKKSMDVRKPMKAVAEAIVMAWEMKRG